MKPYNLKIDTPLSDLHNTPQWYGSTMDKLGKLTNNAVYLIEAPQGDNQFVWRVTDARLCDEDTTITRFRAFDSQGNYVPIMTFGVSYPGNPHKIDPTSFNHRLPTKELYVPIDNQMHTPNTGGYTVQVLDLDHPSEALAFGSFKQDNMHRALVITFRLFEMANG